MQYFGFVGTPNMGDLNAENMQDMAKKGVAMGVIGNIMNAREQTDPVTLGGQLGTVPPAPTGWVCTCGCSCTGGSFCPECGTKRPDAAWDCTCGSRGLTTKFCTNCGKKRP
ncbi:MAG: hypothetical protein Q4A05_11560 [Ruminococcus sp.]|nr:hypothetical protein [Ruminococcus sp.]